MSIEREYSTAQAARVLDQHLEDGRDYSQLLADQRRGKRDIVVPHHYLLVRGQRRPFYFESDLMRFISIERNRGVTSRPRFARVEVERDDSCPPVTELLFWDAVETGGECLAPAH